MKSSNLLQLAQAYEPDMVRFLQALIQIPSVNGRDSKKAVAERIVAEAEKLGLRMSWLLKIKSGRMQLPAGGTARRNLPSSGIVTRWLKGIIHTGHIRHLVGKSLTAA